MSIEVFHRAHGDGELVSIEALCQRWEREKEVDAILHTAVGGGVVLGDLLYADGLVDQVSPEVMGAFETLMGGRADTYEEVRSYLLDSVEKGDASIFGLINKIKGQVGENQFLEELGGSTATRLADSGNQEAWDIAVERSDGIQYIQVKMYSDPGAVIRHMNAVEEKLASGKEIMDGTNQVQAIDFAVPENIHEEVSSRAAALELECSVLPIKMSAAEAHSIVNESIQNVSEQALENFFEEILGAAASVATIHGLTQAFLCYKGAKEWEEFFSDTTENTMISLGGLLAGAAVESGLRRLAFMGSMPMGVAVMASAITTRALLRRVVQRTSFVQFVRGETEAVGELTLVFGGHRKPLHLSALA